jgi:hypothetical protein
LLGFLAECLALLRAIDPAEADALWVVIVQDVERVSVEDLDSLALILRDSSSRRAGVRRA